MTTPARRRLLLLAFAAATGVAGVTAAGRLTGRSPSTLTVDAATEAPTLSAADDDAVTVRTACGQARLATRPYGLVTVGSRLEVLAPEAGQLIALDPGAAHDDAARASQAAPWPGPAGVRVP